MKTTMKEAIQKYKINWMTLTPRTRQKYKTTINGKEY